MNLKRIKTTICAGMLAVAMLVPGMTAFAAEGDEDSSSASSSPLAETGDIIDVSSGTGSGLISKTLIYDKKITFKDGLTFTYTIEQEEQYKEDSGTIANETRDNTTALGPVTITLNSKNGTQIGKKTYYHADGTADLNVGKLTSPGVYTYLIKESATYSGTVTDSGAYALTPTLIMDKTQYRLRVYVEDIGSSQVARSVTLEQLTDRYGNSLSQTKKLTKAAFQNYVQGKFTISKVVDDPFGTQQDGTEYTFHVAPTIYGGAGDYVELPNPILYNIVGGTNPSTGNQLTLSDTNAVNNIKGGEIKITAGQQIVFTNLPEGVIMNVREMNYKDQGVKSIDCIEYHSYQSAEQNAKSKDITSNGEKDDVETSLDTRLIYTNVYTRPTVTGVVTDIAPYITLVVIAIAGITAYIIIRKRMR